MTSTPLSEERLRWIEFDAGQSNSIVLSDTEARIARRLLSDEEHDLNFLDIQIADFHQREDKDARLERLCAAVWPHTRLSAEQVLFYIHQREHKAARLERLRVAVAPHKRLPMEILSYIFGISTSLRALKIPPPDPPHSFPPWTLRHVCSGWRHIILSDRRLVESDFYELRNRNYAL